MQENDSTPLMGDQSTARPLESEDNADKGENI
jgi:hypothetical protein